MPGFRGISPGHGYAGIAGADLANAPQGNVPFTSPYGLPVTRLRTWHAGGVQPGGNNDGVPGRAISRASGNPDVASVPVVPPPHTPYGYPRPLSQGQESDQPRDGSPVGSANDKLISYDRHAFLKSGYENSGRNSGQTDPPMDGPARPSLATVNRTISYQQGTDNTANQDDLSRDYTRNSDGMYVGTQGQGWSDVYGGVPGLWQPYGSYAGVTNGPVRGIQSPVPLGAQGDGPRTVWGGPPHGLHSPTLPDYSQTIGRYQAIPQMRQPRMDHPANSPIAGQSYSQTVVPQGQMGTVVSMSGTSAPSFNQRVRGNGWRGKA